MIAAVSEEGHDGAADVREDERGGARARASAILTEDGVADPVVAVLDGPVAALERQQASSRRGAVRQARQEVGGLAARFFVRDHDSLNLADLFSAGPFGREVLTKPRRDPKSSGLEAAAMLVDRLREVVRRATAPCFKGGSPADRRLLRSPRVATAGCPSRQTGSGRLALQSPRRSPFA